MKKILQSASDLTETGVSRRTFLKAASAGGALIVMAQFPWFTQAFATGVDSTSGGEFDLNACVRIGPDNSVTLIMPRVEMGQGTYTALSLLIAEELGVEPEAITLEHAPANEKLYGNSLLGGAQTTGGSTSVASAWEPMRLAGAAARIMLIQAAAVKWGVAPSSCKAENRFVLHPDSKQRLSFGELAESASAFPVPQNIKLLDPKDFKLIGKSQRRLDAPGKVNGTAKFGIDIQIPGMLIAAVSASPSAESRVASIDINAAKNTPGVKQVIDLGDLVAVLADHNGAARKGLVAAKIVWSDGKYKDYSSAVMEAELEEASKRDGAVARTEGDVVGAAKSAARTIEAVYQQPFMAHAAMEPMNCIVRLSSDLCEVWTGTQAPAIAQRAASAASGLPVGKVIIHNQLLGGGFGRRLDADIVTQAVRIAVKANSPVKVVWSREEDIQHDFFRPAHYNRISASLDKEGKPIAWQHRVTGSSVMARYLPEFYTNDIDGDAIRDAAGPYSFDNVLIQFVRQESGGINTGWWRGVGHVQNAFPVECFLDELSHAADQDPIQYRLKLLKDHPRAVNVLNTLVKKANWSAPSSSRIGKGVSLTLAFGTYAAQMTEVSVADDGTIKLLRIVTVVDCGLAVSPPTIEAQVEGGNVFGLSAALYGNISISNGRIQQSNFHDFRVMRIDEMPIMETHIIPSALPPTGIGEVATVLAAPSLVNAIFSATGVRVRKLPIEPSLLRR